jgi:hypothetical protein
LYRRYLRPDAPEHETLRVLRASTLAFGVLGTVAALLIISGSSPHRSITRLMAVAKMTRTADCQQGLPTNVWRIVRNLLEFRPMKLIVELGSLILFVIYPLPAILALVWGILAAEQRKLDLRSVAAFVEYCFLLVSFYSWLVPAVDQWLQSIGCPYSAFD